MPLSNKWSKTFFADLAERVGSTFLQALLGCLVLTGTTPVDWSDGKAIWAVLVVPTVAALIKGLLANMADPESGPSALPAPPAPEVTPEPAGHWEIPHEADVNMADPESGPSPQDPDAIQE